MTAMLGQPVVVTVGPHAPATKGHHATATEELLVTATPELYVTVYLGVPAPVGVDHLARVRGTRTAPAIHEQVLVIVRVELVTVSHDQIQYADLEQTIAVPQGLLAAVTDEQVLPVYVSRDAQTTIGITLIKVSEWNNT